MGVVLLFIYAPLKMQSQFRLCILYLGGFFVFWKNLYLRLCAKAIRYRIPVVVRQVYLDYDGFFNSLCPRCHSTLPWEYIAFCPRCGQRLSWVFLDDAEELEKPFDAADICSESVLSFTMQICKRHIKKLVFGLDYDTWLFAHYKVHDIEEQCEEEETDDSILFF